MFDSIVALDTQISLWLRSLVIATDSLAPVVRVFSDIEVLLVAVLIVACWLYGVYKREVGFKIAALDIFYTVMFAFALYWVLQFGLPMRPRPESITSLTPLINHLPDNSFPSGHAIFAGASVVAIGYFLSMSLSTAYAVLGFCMVIARVIAGVHYFGDILVGVILGALFARVAIAARERIGMKTILHSLPLRIASYIRL